MKPSDIDLDALLKRLHLANARRAWRSLIERAEKEEWSYRDFLALLVAEEVAHRQQTRTQRLSRRALFPSGMIMKITPGNRDGLRVVLRLDALAHSRACRGELFLHLSHRRSDACRARDKDRRSYQPWLHQSPQ